ncbi:MAG: gamma-glutamyltransferase [Flammeovirgaceae bacterium]|nr:gamma-glutamyltransferase [Flammeovirgaceae bacterium]MBR06470.1 gamma-glutamyltransferase [Rickettsiales bacterium]HCX22544.1 gamma-glutamyltransferase [Cytophagales bacterium]|tara:strand:- start:4147 stop:5838 length:1692 start_codon:yes stop_codon:yes gene_type:complete
MRILKSSFIITLAIIIVSCGGEIHESKVGAIGDSAMVVSAHPLATKAGVFILKNGGNAYDAAIATQFALAVVYPRAGNIGGGGFAVIRESDGDLGALDFREKAPMAAFKTMFQNDSGRVISELSTIGHLGAGVPGSVAGMWQLHQKYGSLPWAQLVQPAIDIAFEGHRITADEADALNEKQENFKEANDWSPWVINDDGWHEGAYVRQLQLAATLSFIRDSGRDGFYKGIVANLIATEMERGGGIITLEDLEKYEAVWREPLIGHYKGHKVISMPPTSSGGVALLQLLQGAEQVNIGKYPHNGVEAVHLMAEIEKRVFADRAKHLGDPDYYNVPSGELISKSYNDTRFKGVDTKSITPSSQIKGGDVMYESDQTTHFSIVDKDGNAISVTTTLNLNYGCKVWVKGAGFVLNNEMDDFSAKPGVPNFFGLVGAEANSIAPGKRMLSSMTPTILEKDGQLKAVLGSPGGATIITSVFQTVLNLVDYNMTMQEAVEGKKVHHQWLPDQIKMETGAISDEDKAQLEKQGYLFQEVEKIGRNDCILVLPNGQLEGGSDPRGDDYAEGY